MKESASFHFGTAQIYWSYFIHVSLIAYKYRRFAQICLITCLLSRIGKEIY